MTYKEKKVNEHFIREFDNTINQSDLVWHRDKEDRIIKVLENSGWQIQMDNKLPVLLEIDNEFFIPKETWHRVIRGTDKLVIKLTKLE
jgi:hypothetical protein